MRAFSFTMYGLMAPSSPLQSLECECIQYENMSPVSNLWLVRGPLRSDRSGPRTNLSWSAVRCGPFWTATDRRPTIKSSKTRKNPFFFSVPPVQFMVGPRSAAVEKTQVGPRSDRNGPQRTADQLQFFRTATDHRPTIKFPNQNWTRK